MIFFLVDQDRLDAEVRNGCSAGCYIIYRQGYIHDHTPHTPGGGTSGHPGELASVGTMP